MHLISFNLYRLDYVKRIIVPPTLSVIIENFQQPLKDCLIGNNQAELMFKLNICHHMPKTCK